jgi:hypothetical protein
MSRALTRLWAQLILTPQRLRHLQMAALISAITSVLLLGVGLTQLNRIRADAESYRAAALNPPEQPTLPPEEQELIKTIEQIAAQLTSVPNAQAFVISQLSHRATQQGLSVVGVETSEPPGEPAPSGSPTEWKSRLLRFRLSGSSQQMLHWLQSLEGVPLVVKLTGVQITANTGEQKGVSAVVEMEVQLPPSPSTGRAGVWATQGGGIQR